MPLTPCPSPLPSALRDEQAVPAQRNLFCLHYDGCLHLAVKRGWEGWSCRQCPLRHWRALEPEARDYAHCRPRGPDGT